MHAFGHKIELCVSYDDASLEQLLWFSYPVEHGFERAPLFRMYNTGRKLYTVPAMIKKYCQ